MLLASLSRRVSPLATSHSFANMLTVVSARLPFAATRAHRGAALPAPSAPPRSFATITRAQKEPQKQPEATAQAESESSSGGQQLQPRTGAELSTTTPRGGDLLDLPFLLPTPFRRMTDNMLQMQREMDSLMGAFGMLSPLSALADPFDIFDRATAPLLARRTGAAGRGALGRMIPLDVEEDADGYTVTAEVPGFDKKEIKVSLSEGGMLTMTGSHEEGSLEGETEGAAREGAAAKEGGKEGAAQRGGSRRYASFVRSVQLPDDVDMDSITASTEKGVLTVRIPKTPKPEPKRREIPVA